MPGRSDPSWRHTTPYLRFYFLALNKGTCHCVQIEEWYTGFIFVSRAWIDLMDAWLSATASACAGGAPGRGVGQPEAERAANDTLVPVSLAWCRAS